MRSYEQSDRDTMNVWKMKEKSNKQQQQQQHTTSRECVHRNIEKKATTQNENKESEREKNINNQMQPTSLSTKMEWMCIGNKMNKIFVKMNIFGAVKSRKRHSPHCTECNEMSDKQERNALATHTHTIAKHKAIRLRIFDFHFIYGECERGWNEAGNRRKPNNR